jgi:hypothetical protein
MPHPSGECLPNFLIVGAAKCGTTTLFEALSRHPEIFLPHLKEPRFLAIEAWPKPPVGAGDAEMFRYSCDTTESYMALFRGAAGKRARGEASADTFYYHQTSVPKIRSVLGDPKIIILLRDPAARAFSAYSHLRRDGRETVSFEEGLRAESDRIARGYEYLWHYYSAGCYLEGVRNFRANFTDVLTIEFEKFTADPKSHLEQVCRFLGVRADVNFRIVKAANKSGLPRWQNVFDFVQSPAWWKAPLKAVLPLGLRRRVKDHILGAMLRPLEKEDALLEALSRRYEGESEALAQLLGWTPSWLLKRSRLPLQIGRR